MKTIIRKSVLTVALLSLAIMATLGQNYQGVAIYKTVRDLGSMSVETNGMTDEMKSQIATLMQQRAQKTFILSFSDTEASWVESKNPDRKRKYRDISKSVYIEEADIMGDTYLIKDKLKPQDWKLTEETKQIGPYTAKKATQIRTWQSVVKGDKNSTMRTDTVEVVAWYTLEVPVTHGPNTYWGLPGLVLTLDDGKVTYECSSVTTDPDQELIIAKPNIGKKVSQEEFIKIRKEKAGQLLKSFGGDD